MVKELLLLSTSCQPPRKDQCDTSSSQHCFYEFAIRFIEQMEIGFDILLDSKLQLETLDFSGNNIDNEGEAVD